VYLKGYPGGWKKLSKPLIADVSLVKVGLVEKVLQ
jgi:hypothetical protein